MARNRPRRRHQGKHRPRPGGTVPVRIGAGNWPTRSAKKWFIPPPARHAAAVVGSMRRARLHIETGAEAYPRMYGPLRALPTAGVTVGKANGPYPARNAIAHSRTTDPRVSRRGHLNIRCDYHRYPRTGLNMPAGLYQLAGASFVVVALHLPIQESTQGDEWQQMVDRVARVAVEWAQRNGAATVILSGDWNRRRDVVEKALGVGWRVVSTDGVMHIAVWGQGSETADGVLHEGYDHVVSDHAGLPWVELALPVGI